MNKNVTKTVFLVILALGLGFVLYKNFFTESPEERERRERLEATIEARQSGASPSTDSGASTGEGASAGPAAAGPIPEEEAIDIKQLTASIKEVEFDYEDARKEEQMRNPMAPLVGPYVAQAPLSATDDQGAVSESEEVAIAAIRRNLRLAGIMWHPTDPIAIINNEVIPKGYTFPGEMFRTARSHSGILENGVSVERITQNSVILKYKDSEITLELKER
ncbi:MAG: hypothetical protein R6V12_15555 [Candidatus Hydrogenedentota bacterium]